MNIKACLSHKTDDWKTPKAIYDYFIVKCGCYDPCPFQSQKDGLAEEWKNDNFVNPPYSQLKKWVIKSIEEHKKRKDVTLLIPARTDTQAFKMLYEYGAQFIFITGRLKFNDSNPAPFPSMLVILTGKGYGQISLIDRDFFERRK